ncbi:hypothetical protein FRACYDRAFT_264722 [Fragilariopsis cylindrus CCMP1102]|uniref:Uncharacterized protein n=1 Tax=Fragilariopsis cylindrus CCMP1102 TaxID=635003 RepID=A0A1E7EQH8_9STRA|nr:hypothetical protein FRACYDRAFT_264722 [Fragilariopsis cylindrus CCMP1102]|eukprot:OEU08056.1 hypothetical protein FRACYDRAFT_264722 [Fragilariopsis cylindrus CCMP1102]
MTEAIEFEVEQSDDKYDEEEEFEEEEEEEGFKTPSPKKRKAAPKTTTPKDVYKKESSRRRRICPSKILLNHSMVPVLLDGLLQMASAGLGFPILCGRYTEKREKNLSL